MINLKIHELQYLVRTVMRSTQSHRLEQDEQKMLWHDSSLSGSIVEKSVRVFQTA